MNKGMPYKQNKFTTMMTIAATLSGQKKTKFYFVELNWLFHLTWAQN